MENLTYLEHFLYSTVGSICFAVFLSVSKRDILLSGIIGGISWVFYIFLKRELGGIIAPYFIATLLIGFIGNALSFKNKKNALVYIIPGIIPLVPGYAMYYMMFYIVNDNYSKALESGANAIFIALSIAAALLIMGSLKIISDSFVKGLDESGRQIIKIKNKIVKYKY